MAPIDLSALSREEFETKEGRVLGWAELPDQIREEGVAAGVTLLLEALKDRLRRVAMFMEQAHNLSAIRIEHARTSDRFAGGVAGSGEPFGGGL